MSADEPTIDDLKALQAKLGLCDIHLCWIGLTRFVIAHTDEERASIPLEECEFHQWLFSLAAAPARVGYYQAFKHIADPDSESYGAHPWDLVSVVPEDQAPGWLSMDDAPRDGTPIEGYYGPDEAVPIRWAEERVCMLAGTTSGAGRFGPGWEDVANGLVVDDPIAWRPATVVPEDQQGGPV